jgi:hypothetical protein
MAELRLEQAEGGLVPAEVATYVIADLASSVRTHLQGLSARLVPLVAPVSDLRDVQTILDGAIAEALTHFSQTFERKSKELQPGA